MIILSKSYQPTKLYIGEDKLNDLPEVLGTFGKRVLFVSTDDAPLQPLFNRIHDLLVDFDVVHFKGVVPNPTIESVEACLKLMRGIDVILAVGGGSSIDTAKAVNLKAVYTDETWEALFDKFGRFDAQQSEKFLPMVSVPTTSGTGSHVTQAAVLSMGEDKLTLFHQGLMSDVAILDPKLTTTLPARLTSATAFDAFTHAFESYLSVKSNPLTRVDSINAMKIVVDNLPKVLEDPNNIALRTQLMVADTLGGRALSNAGAHAPHPISEIIGGIAHAMHGEALASVYPSFIKIGYPKFKEEFDTLNRLLFEKEDLYQSMVDFLKRINLVCPLNSLLESESMYETIKHHPVWDFLPFGDRTFFENILDDAY